MQRLRPRRSLWIWLLAGLAAALLACWVVAVLLLRSLDGPFLNDIQENLTRSEIENLARITIPPDATNVHALAGGFQDAYISVRLDLPAESLPAMAVTRYWPTLTPNAEVTFQSGMMPDRPWWRPGEAQSFLAGSNFVDGISQTVLVDTTDPSRVVVYVQTFET
jgi:hypothetical protein